MSHTFPTTHLPVDHDEWERILAQLRTDAFSPIESIKITRAVLQVSLGEAKRIVHQSTAWADLRAEFEDLHEAAASSAQDL
jgi:ribosomal protein L7/L12